MEDVLEHVGRAILEIALVAHDSNLSPHVKTEILEMCDRIRAICEAADDTRIGGTLSMCGNGQAC